MADHYILDGHDAVEADLMEWATWLDKADRRVDHTYVGQTRISTVFLGLNHRFDDDGPPLLFETMVFAEPTTGNECYCDRYTTWEEAEAGHAKAVAWVENGMPDPDQAHATTTST